MHKPFYASGFLYHVATQQILLHQANISNNPLSFWKMFGDFSHKDEDAHTAFQRILFEQLHIKLPTTHLLPVYDYDLNTRNTIHYVFYAEVPKLSVFPLGDRGVFSWFTFKQTTKLIFSDQAKQDVMVSERVVNAQARSIEPKILSDSAQHSNLFH